MFLSAFPTGIQLIRRKEEQLLCFDSQAVCVCRIVRKDLFSHHFGESKRREPLRSIIFLVSCRPIAPYISTLHPSSCLSHWPALWISEGATLFRSDIAEVWSENLFWFHVFFVSAAATLPFRIFFLTYLTVLRTRLAWTDGAVHLLLYNPKDGYFGCRRINLNRLTYEPVVVQQPRTADDSSFLPLE
jgi:hypothetical protein